jgi:hypothetical protein
LILQHFRRIEKPRLKAGAFLFRPVGGLPLTKPKSVASWFYAVCHFAMWLFRRDGSHRLKAIRGGAVFLAGGAFAFTSGFIGVWLGSWQQISDGKF